MPGRALLCKHGKDLREIAYILTQYLDGVYKIPLGAVPDLASVVALVGVPDVLHLQIVPDQGYPGVHADYLLSGAYEGGAPLPHDHERPCKNTRKCLYCRNVRITLRGGVVSRFFMAPSWRRRAI